MKKERNNTRTILIDIQYHDSINMFEFEYGDFISYKEIEQKSYIAFKESMFDSISRNIKFRKYGRIGKILTIKANMLKNEVDFFQNLLEENKMNIGNGWIISNVTLITDEKSLDKNNKFDKKISESEDDDDKDSTLESEIFEDPEFD